MAWIGVALLSAAFAGLALVPWRTAPFSVNLDYSWQLALNVAFADRLAFGRDVVFTYGPLGLLYAATCYPPTARIRLLVRIALAVALWLGLWTVARRTI